MAALMAASTQHLRGETSTVLDPGRLLKTCEGLFVDTKKIEGLFVDTKKISFVLCEDMLALTR